MRKSGGVEQQCLPMRGESHEHIWRTADGKPVDNAMLKSRDPLDFPALEKAYSGCKRAVAAALAPQINTWDNFDSWLVDSDAYAKALVASRELLKKPQSSTEVKTPGYWNKILAGRSVRQGRAPHKSGIVSARPRSRAILVEAHVSSIKTSRSGSRSGWLSNQAWRRFTMSGRSRSVAWAVFFCTSGRSGRETSTASPERRARRVSARTTRRADPGESVGGAQDGRDRDQGSRARRRRHDRAAQGDRPSDRCAADAPRDREAGPPGQE